MFRDHIAYLSHLEAMALNEDLAQYYLWPRTPIRATLQEEIIRCVGVSDFDLSQEHSRPSQIIRFIWRLLRADLIWRQLFRSGFTMWGRHCTVAG